MKSNQIWVLHSFVKKTQKIPKNELDIANERLRELKNER
ncbi:MAG: Phage derived protein Gp49-like [Burkholderiales bacterium]|jgi:phage-related protein|nr:Phage derived protein Gp49-like [Burkholderiales bacterium]